jgi:hypothetical protein
MGHTEFNDLGMAKAVTHAQRDMNSPGPRVVVEKISITLITRSLGAFSYLWTHRRTRPSTGSTMPTKS